LGRFIIRHGGIIFLNLISVFNFTLMTLSKKYNVYPTFLFILLIDVLYILASTRKVPEGK
jgi:hypothetical protein